MNNDYRLFALTIFLSSFLLFQIQPLISKHILPWFGGSSAVWITAMFFFMVMLAFGYIYALFLTKLSLRTQVITHLSILSAALGLLFYQRQLWSVSITPSLEQVNLTTTDPTISIIFVLLVTIGLPFALLASSSTLLQFWYGRLSGQEPFSLYSISNVGSLLGLITFPFLFEPILTTIFLGQVWTTGFLFYVLLIFLLGLKLFLYTKANSTTVEFTLDTYSTEKISSTFFRWLLVASVPVLTMLAGTAFLTTSIAPVPMLWVGPLALYLVSFIVSFKTRSSRLPVFINEVFVLLSSILAMIMVLNHVAFPLPLTIVLIHVAMFAVFHWCHEYLYASRPTVDSLPVFYVALAWGGILGSVVMLISTLYVLVLPVELLVVFVGSVLVIAYRWYRLAPDQFELLIKREARPVFLLFIASMVIVMSLTHVVNKNYYALEMKRNFFGYKAVLEYPYKGNDIRALQHGITNHGFQRIEDDQLVIEPASYYGTGSGVGIAISYKQMSKETLNVVVLGLGAGGLAAHCRAEDKYEFIEIDPQVINLARQHFSYLDYCAQASVTEADGRLALAGRKNDELYDLIILDAYADDMMPIHIMTNEALAIYKSMMKTDGIIAMNISSRYLDLLPVAATLAETNNLVFRSWYDREPSNSTSIISHWVLFSLDTEVFKAEQFALMSDIADIERRVTWTDTYSALWPIVKLW